MLSTFIRTTLAAVFFLGFANTVHATSLELYLELVMQENRDTYEVVASGENKYEQKEAFAEVDVLLKMKASGMPEQKTTSHMTVTDVPGISDGGKGYSFANLEKTGSKIELVTDAKIIKKEKKKNGKDENRDGEEDEVEVETESLRKMRLPLEFVEGNWAAYERGDEVELRLNKDGVNKLLTTFQAEARAGASGSSTGGRVRISAEAKLVHGGLFAKTNEKTRGLIVASKKKLTVVWPDLRVKSSVSARS